MEDTLPILKQSALFYDIPEEILRRDILPHGQMQEFSVGQHLLFPQQEVNRFSILLSGRVHLTHLFSDGSDSLMTVLTPAHVLGADLICTPTRRSPYHAIAAAPGRSVAFPADLLLCPGAAEEAYRLTMLNHLLTLISNANMKREYRLAILSQKGLRERILTYLTMQATKRQTSTFTIPFSREELASYLCVNRSALSHELSRMQQDGLISFRKNTFTLRSGGE